MTIDVAGLQAVSAEAAGGLGGGQGAAEAGGGPQQISVGHGGSMTSDLAMFTDSLQAARQQEVPAVSPVVEAMMEPLGAIDREAASFGETAQAAQASGNELTPSEILDLTVRSQEFMFHSQLTSNIANRTSDGLQQLFRQQG